MDDFLGIIRQRSEPGILIYDAGDRLCFSNGEGEGLLQQISKIGPIPNTSGGQGHSASIISELLNRTRKVVDRSACSAHNHTVVIDNNGAGTPYCLRAFPVRETDALTAGYILILIEKIYIKRSVNLESAKEKYNLTPREIDVLKLVCAGLSNKDIATGLRIGEYTVKDHVKKLMVKIGVSSRTRIMSSI